ncbi:MAG TPA: DUF4234 domain-containing protein [Saprospiraceae bacterium]|nr:DUF4234 domain-containing protein [Saprospiraceae bacterium]
MTKRNPLTVFLLSIFTCGIYSWYWIINTKNEMNKMGEKIPTAWIWLIPIVGPFWWYWKYSEGVENISKKELNLFLVLLALYLLGPIGMAIVQEAFNRSSAPVTEATPPPISSVYQPGTTVLPPIPPVQAPPTTPSEPQTMV